jgi:ribosome-binding protein aMBF1 (putative translation factor)
LVSILSQSLHFCELCSVCMMSFMPHVSPVRYSRLQCCRKCPHFQSPQANLC